MDNKKTNIIIITISFMILFCAVCYLTVFKFDKPNGNSMKKEVNNKNGESLAVGNSKTEILSKDGKMIFKVKYDKSGNFSKVKEIQVKDMNKIVGKTEQQIEMIYKSQGYKVQEFSPKRVVLYKTEDKYMPNKYVLGIKGDKLAIFRTDKCGNMYIEDEVKDITDIKVSRLKEQDVHMLTKGDKYFECDSREQVESLLGDYE